MEEMETIKPLENINIAEVCRACFETCEQYKMLFDEADSIEKRTLGDVFFDVVKIEMKANSETPPSRICISCSNDLMSAYSFIQKSQKNNERLLQYLKNANIKKPDCLTEFPMDIPADQNIADFLHIKVEDEGLNDYNNDSMPDDRHSPENSSDSDGSDYEPLIQKKQKINKMQCTYCDRIFKRQDFLENHIKKHEADIKKKEVVEDSEDETAGKKRTCQECGFSCNSKLEMDDHKKAEHTTSFDEELNSSVNVEANLKALNTSNICEDNKTENLFPTIACTEPEISKNSVLGTMTTNPPCETSSPGSKRASYQKIQIDQKKLFVELYESGQTIKTAAAAANINPNTAKAILRNYKERSDIIEKRCGGNRPRKLTSEVLSTIEECVEKNPGIQLQQIKKLLSEQKFHMSISTISNGLRELMITLNLPSYNADQINMPRAIERRRIFALDFADWALDDRHKMVFIDECVFTLQPQTPTVRKVINGRKAVVIAAINSNGIIHSKIFGKMSCNTTEFAMFLRELVNKISSLVDMTEAILIMDNAGIHESRVNGSILAASKYCTRTLPPFSPMLNPLGKVFVKMKVLARSLLTAPNLQETSLVEILQTSASAITATDCSSFVMDVVLLLHDAIAGRPFQC